MLSAHALELKLTTLLVLRLDAVDISERQLEAKTAQIKRLPLGPLIKRFIAEYRVEDELCEELDNMLYFRNELAHRISDSVLGEALDPGLRYRLVTELLEIQSYFQEKSAMLKPYVDEWLHANGLTRQKLVSIGMTVYKGLESG